MPYHTIPFHDDMPHHTVAYHTIPHYTIPSGTTPWYVYIHHMICAIPYDTTLKHAIPHHTIIPTQNFTEKAKLTTTRSGRPVSEGCALRKSASRSATSREASPERDPGGGVAPTTTLTPQGRFPLRRASTAAIWQITLALSCAAPLAASLAPLDPRTLG